MLPWMILGGAALGAAKGAEEKKAWKAQQAAEAETTRMSPWTGMKGKTLAEPSSMGPVLQGAMTGAVIGEGLGGEKPAGGEPKPKMDQSKVDYLAEQNTVGGRRNRTNWDNMSMS